MIIIYITQVWHFLLLKIIDTINYFLHKDWLTFKGFGLHIYTGMFGTGKTSSMVHDAYRLTLKYPQINILTNMRLSNFPKHTKIIELKHYNDIVTCPANTLILIDELSSIFNSRDWKKGGVPAPLLGMLLQCRKQKKELFATAQRFIHVDALFRQITFTVRECKCIHERWNFINTFDGYDVDNQNVMMPAKCLSSRAFVQSNFFRNLYNTEELIQKMSTTEYIPDCEILEKQGLNSNIVVVNQDLPKPSISDRLLGKNKKIS